MEIVIKSGSKCKSSFSLFSILEYHLALYLICHDPRVYGVLYSMYYNAVISLFYMLYNLYYDHQTLITLHIDSFIIFTTNPDLSLKSNHARDDVQTVYDDIKEYVTNKSSLLEAASTRPWIVILIFNHHQYHHYFVLLPIMSTITYNYVRQENSQMVVVVSGMMKQGWNGFF